MLLKMISRINPQIVSLQRQTLAVVQWNQLKYVFPISICFESKVLFIADC